MIHTYFKGPASDYTKCMAHEQYKDKLLADGWVLSLDELKEAPNGNSRKGHKSGAKSNSGSAGRSSNPAE